MNTKKHPHNESFCTTVRPHTNESWRWTEGVIRHHPNPAMPCSWVGPSGRPSFRLAAEPRETMWRRSERKGLATPSTSYRVLAAGPNTACRRSRNSSNGARRVALGQRNTFSHLGSGCWYNCTHSRCSRKIQLETICLPPPPETGHQAQ